MRHMIFDTEIIGEANPVFLTCCEVVETGERHAFWHDKKGHTKKLAKLLESGDYTWVGFNSLNFDHPLMCMAVEGYDELDLKHVATAIINERMNHWQSMREFQIKHIPYDHIDLYEVAPGVKISLKTYAGRMGYPTMQDTPFHHNEEIKDSPKKRKIVENYCFNDIGVTRALFLMVKGQLDLRRDLSEEHDIDLRSKSDAQVAEAILKKIVGIKKKETFIPRYVEYTPPEWITTKNAALKELVHDLGNTDFIIDRITGSPHTPDWLKDYEFRIKDGSYTVGIGGLHSTHDIRLYREETDEEGISDFDVGSYYPSIMLKCGLVPQLGGNKGEIFLDAYRDIYERRLEAKHAGLKVVADSLKITLNGTYGKLGSLFSSFYAPDLMLAVTLTGQLNLLCLIDELERIKGVSVLSANTDGITVQYKRNVRERVLKVFTANSKRTGFDYEETPYKKIAMKDVNNYLALTTSGKVKSKGLYAEKGLMKNPTMQVCTNMAIAYLKDGVKPEVSIKKFTDVEDFMEIRNVKGGGVQHQKFIKVDDWELIEDYGSAKNVWMSPTSGKKEKRKSRPKPYDFGVGGEPFGRVARWYMTTKHLPPITYVDSGNRVPGTDGAKVCMTLPEALPADLNYEWYINEAYRILGDIGALSHSCRVKQIV